MRRALFAGAAAWLAYAILHVVVSGPVLDDSVIAGQVIAGQIEYPPGHPHDIYFRTTFSLSHFLSAALLAAGAGVELVSALRNVLFLFLSTVTPFLVGVALTRRPVVGHAAAALVLLGAAQRFGGLYPVWVFPNFNSNGHIGLSLAVALVALTALERWRTSGFLFGLLPSVHGAMAAMAWPATAFVLLARRMRGERLLPPGFLAGAAVGGAITAGLALYIGVFAEVAPPTEPFVGASEAAPLRDALMVTGHRAPAPWRTMGYLVNPVLFFGGCGLVLVFARRGDSSTRRALSAFAVLGGIAWSFIAATDLWRRFAPWPDALGILMPGRFSNLTQAMLVPVWAAAVFHVLARVEPKRRVVLGAAVALGLAGLVVVAGASPVEGARMVSRQALFLTIGVALGLGAARLGTLDRRDRIVALIAAAAVMGSMIPFFAVSRFAAYTLVVAAAAFLGHRALQWLRPRLPRRFVSLARVAPILAISAVALSTLQGRRADLFDAEGERWDVISEADRELRDWFAANTRPDELVLAPWTWRRTEVQGKFERPALLKMESAWFSTYRPDIAPAVHTLVRDLYGVDFGEPPPPSLACDRLSPWCSVWEEAWASRSAAEWSRLGATYSFRHVVAPTDWELALEPAFVGEEFSVYEIE